MSQGVWVSLQTPYKPQATQVSGTATDIAQSFKRSKAPCIVGAPRSWSRELWQEQGLGPAGAVSACKHRSHALPVISTLRSAKPAPLSTRVLCAHNLLCSAGDVADTEVVRDAVCACAYALYDSSLSYIYRWCLEPGLTGFNKDRVSECLPWSLWCGSSD
jgi:hypothetical protein